MRASRDRLSPACLPTELVVNLGVWGFVPFRGREFVRVNREFEELVARLGGRKVLYAHAYYTEREFWEIYPRQWYERLRDACSAGKVFPSVFEKTAVTGEHEASVLRGILSGVRAQRLPVGSRS